MSWNPQLHIHLKFPRIFDVVGLEKGLNRDLEELGDLFRAARGGAKYVAHSASRNCGPDATLELKFKQVLKNIRRAYK